MCDILKRLSSNALTKQQYLSNLNEFSRLCRAKKQEDLFKPVSSAVAGAGHGPPATDRVDDDNNVCTLDDVFRCLKSALFHDAAEVRAATLRAIRYLLKDETAVKSLLRVDLPIFIVRSIDIVLENRTERIQALRLVRKFLSISPHLFPSAFTRSLLAIAQDGQVEHDTLTRACWALLAELSIMSPNSSTRDTQNCAFNAIMDAALAGNQSHGMCESLISTLLYMLNWPRYRSLIRGDLDLQIFVAPFTDSHYTAPVSKDKKQKINQTAKFDVDPYDQRENKFTAAKITLISILRSWQGLIYLCEPQSKECNLVSNSCLKSLINMLYLPYNDVRRRLIDLIFKLLYLPLPESLDDFESGLILLEKHQLSKDSWKIHDAFVVDEAKAILRPIRSRSRMDLVNNYMSLLLVALFQCNVVDALSKVIISPSNHENSIRATILLYQLLSLSYQHLPTDSFSQHLTLSTLISHATSKNDDSRDLANAALINLGRVHPFKNSSNYTTTRCSMFLSQILEFCSPHLIKRGGIIDNSSGGIHKDRSGQQSCSMSTTSTLNSLSSNLSSNQGANNSSSSSTSTLVNYKQLSRSQSLSTRSSSILSRSSSVTAATSQLLNLLSFPTTTKSSIKTILEQDWPMWDWELINFILTRPSDGLRKMSSPLYKAFIRRIVHFFKPSSNEYSLIDINNECNRQLCETGCNMVDFLAENPEPRAMELLRELLHDISISMHDPESASSSNSLTTNNFNSSTLGTSNQSLSNSHQQTGPTSNMMNPPHVMQHPSEINILSSSKLITTMSSTYFIFIGRLSSTMRGYQMLERSKIMKLINNLTQTSMLATSPAEVYVRLMISCFDYTKEFNGSRRLLEKFLFYHPEENVRIYATNFLRVLLRANVQDFASWAIELLVRQLDSPLRVVRCAAAEILDEACDVDENLEGLIEIKYIKTINGEQKGTLDLLRSSGDSGILLLCRYASSPVGLKQLIEAPRRHLSIPLDSVLSSTPATATTESTTPTTKPPTRENVNNKNEDLTDTTTTTNSIAPDSIANAKTIPAVNLNDGTDSSAYGGSGITSTSSSKVSLDDAKSIMKVESEFDVELNRWQRVFNYRYVKLVEGILNNALTYHQKGEDGKYGRRIDRINPMTKNSYLPPHLYSQLALHQEGIEIINNRNLLGPVYEMLRNPPTDLNYSEASVLRFKAALWIIGHVGSSETGYQILDNSRELIRLITEVARTAEVLSLRGTSFYVLGLLGSTEEGAEEMKEYRWMVQRDSKIALPLELDLILTKPKDDVPRSSPVGSTCSSRCGQHKSHSDDDDAADDGNQQQKSSDSNQSSGPAKDSNNGDVAELSPIKASSPLNDMVNLHPVLKETYSTGQLEQIRHDVLKYVATLSCSMGTRQAENGLLHLKRQYGAVFQYDLGLYAEVCNQLAKHNFGLHARRFLQELFLDITISTAQPQQMLNNSTLDYG